MEIYHTSNIEIKHPDIHHGRVNADFGQGFYLTPDRDFTFRWAGRDSVVNVYDLDLSGLNVHRFSRNLDWFNYIFSNRKAKDTLNADIIIGPIANDTIYDTLGVISSGHLKPDEALKLLMVGPEYTQIAIKSEKAVKQLVWKDSLHGINKSEYAAEYKKEQEDYLDKFTEAMKSL